MGLKPQPRRLASLAPDSPSDSPLYCQGPGSTRDRGICHAKPGQSPAVLVCEQPGQPSRVPDKGDTAGSRPHSQGLPAAGAVGKKASRRSGAVTVAQASSHSWTVLVPSLGPLEGASPAVLKYSFLLSRTPLSTSKRTKAATVLFWLLQQAGASQLGRHGCPPPWQSAAPTLCFLCNEKGTIIVFSFF